MKSQTANENLVSVTDHLRELRSRLILASVTFCITFVVCWIFRNDLLNIYLKPLVTNMKQSNSEIVLLNISDKLQVHLITTAFFSFVILIPFFILLLGQFVLPAFSKNDRKIITAILSFIIILFFCGILLSYFIIIPLTFNYFIHYSLQDKGVLSSTVYKTDLRISLKNIVITTQQVVLVFGALFQTPLLLLFICKLGLVRLEKIKQLRRHLYVLIFVISAILTPPDPVSMIFMAIPFVFLFELGIVLCSVFANSTQREINHG